MAALYLHMAEFICELYVNLGNTSWILKVIKNITANLEYAAPLSLSLSWLAVAFPKPHLASFLPACPNCLTFSFKRGSMPHSDPSQAACPWRKGKKNHTEMSLKTCWSARPQSQPSVMFYLALFGTAEPFLSFFFFFCLPPWCCFCNTTLSASKCAPLLTRFSHQSFCWRSE